MISRLAALVARFLALFGGRRLDRELQQDLSSHLELLTDDLVRTGMDPDAARREARLRLGNAAVAADAHRDARSLRWVELVVLDLRYSARVLRRQPLLTAVIVLTLALGIGAPTSVFSLLNGLVFRAPASSDPDAFFRVRPGLGEGGAAATAALYQALRDDAQSVREVVAWSRFRSGATLGPDDPTRVPGLLVSCNFFHVFGTGRPLAGRLFEADDCASARPVAVISERLWQTRFAGQDSVAGSPLQYGRVPVTVIGVASAPPLQNQADDPEYVVDVWFPYTTQPALRSTVDFRFDLSNPKNAGTRWLEVAGFLRPGVSHGAATAEFQVIAGRGDTRMARPDSLLHLNDGSRWAAAPQMWLETMAMVMILPLLILVMASVNVAGLLLSRAVGRQREMAVRLALGTSRPALVRMLFTESLMVAGLAMLASLVLVYNLPPLLVRFFDAELMFGAARTLGPDWRVFAWLGATGIVAAVLAGLAPTLVARSPRLADALHGRRGIVGRQRPSRTRRVLVGIQFAGSMVLLVIAVTFVLAAARVTDVGFPIERLLVAQIRQEPKPAAPLSAVVERLTTASGGLVAAYSGTLPVMREASRRIRLPSLSDEVTVAAASVSPQYFDVLGIALLAGRLLDEQAAAPAGSIPVVVSRQLARRFLGGENVLGMTIESGSPSKPEQLTVVGVVEDRRTGFSGMGAQLTDASMIYEPASRTAMSGALLVRSAAAPTDGLIDALEAEIRRATGLAVVVQTFDSVLAEEVVVVRRLQVLLLAAGLVALLLAVTGVVGTVSFEARQRTKEFAIRRALGADSWAVRRQIVWSGFRALPVALIFGVLTSWGALIWVDSTRMLPIRDVAEQPGPYAAVSILLLTAACLALLAVAFPASRRDPLRALREE